MSQMYEIPCPWCRGMVKATAEWLQNNDRVCCMSCNKAFQVMIKSQAEEVDEDTKGNNDYWD